MGGMSLTNKDRVSDGYQLRQAEKQSDGSTKKMMACMTCGTLFYLKSDIAISQELQRISSYLEPLAEPSCPSPACENHAEGVISSPGAYYTDGKTPTGSQRWKCRSCGSRFSAKGPTVGRKKQIGRAACREGVCRYV